MRRINRFISSLSIFLGLVLLAGALGLTLYNYREGETADRSAQSVVAQIQAARTGQLQAADTALQEFLLQKDEPVPEMATVLIDNHLYIGTLTIPKYNLELPVMQDWDYDKLNISPCRYTGSYFTNDLIIAGHNFPRHFSPLKQIPLGSDIYFTTADELVYHYVVDAVERLDGTAVEEMLSGDWDLTLFTCNNGGVTRCTIRCILAQEP